jgi:resuscitation-promoting factor RpfB
MRSAWLALLAGALVTCGVPVEPAAPALDDIAAEVRMITERGVSPAKPDEIRPAQLAVIATLTTTDRVTVEFEVEHRPDPSLYEDQSRVLTAGQNGVVERTVEIRYHSGQRDEEIVSEQVVIEPVDRVVAVGTKPREPVPEPDPAPEPSEPPPGVWDKIAQCESNGDWSINTGNGHYGGLQFSLPTWQAYTGTGYPHEHPRAEQIRVADRVLAARGHYGDWPHCAAQLGLPTS